MFYIDGVSLSKIKDELKKDLINRKINKITKNTESSLSIYFGKSELVFSCNPNFPVCYITTSKEGVLDNSSGLVDNMRKNLINAMLVDIGQIGYDRILVFKFARINELGEVKNFNIYFEIMGKYSNFIFTDENNIIIDVLKRFSLEENRLRAIFPGLSYEQPIIEKKLLPTDITSEMFDNFQEENTLLKKVEGIGKLLVQNLKSFDDYLEVLKSEINPKIYLNEKEVVLATVLDISPKSKYTNILEFDTYKELVNYYIDSENLSAGFNILKNLIINSVIKKIKKNEKILKVLETEKEGNKNFEKYQQYGDILAASMYSVKKGMTSLEAFDFYNNCTVNIPLEVQLSPQQNLEKFYKKYNKLKRGIEANRRRNAEITEELNYLNSIKVFIDNSENIDNLKQIYDELIAQGYIKKKKEKKGKNKKSNKIIEYGIIDGDGYKILYGRNNIENDNLTFKIADKGDIWLHTKDIPGSHVIIKTDNLTEDVLVYGAKIAAYYSKALLGDKVSVDYTQKKYINKPKGAKPGFVTYVNEKNIIVEKSDI